MDSNFSLKDQICRASVSIPNTMAEGFDRYSRHPLTTVH
ncbi:four helix bundle protein [Tellurirhabdus rosea]